jgi:SAM-dependent methyltransferase
VKEENMGEKRVIKPQVPRAHYLDGYDTKQRFLSYWTQIQAVRELSCAPILEIGVGNRTVNDYLSRAGLDVKSMDIAADLSPDIVASVHDMPFEDATFGTVMACQVLEHLPFNLFPKALSEIRRVTRRYAVISLPNAARAYSISVNLPKIGRREWLLDLSRIPRSVFMPDEEHYWEIGWKGYPVGRITSLMERAGFAVIKSHRVFEFPYHHFFILEKWVET